MEPGPSRLSVLAYATSNGFSLGAPRAVCYSRSNPYEAVVSPPGKRSPGRAALILWVWRAFHYADFILLCAGRIVFDYVDCPALSI